MNDKQNDNAQTILQFIQKNPGCHLREIKRVLDMSMGTIQYHLNLLEKEGKIISEKQHLYKNYFSAGMFKQNEKNILNILKIETLRDIIMFIIEKTNPTQSEIVEKLDLSAASVSWSLSRLIESGMIGERKDGKFKRYHMLEDPKNVVALMKNYHPNMWTNWSTRLAEMFLTFSKEDTQ